MGGGLNVQFMYDVISNSVHRLVFNVILNS
jgi:hypothetical protein